MKKLTASLAALLVAACSNTETDPAQKFRDALPKAEAVSIGTPQDAGATPGALSASSEAVTAGGAKAPFAVDSYYLALAVNGGVVWTLAIVRAVTLFPPTSYDDTSATWGPWIDNDGLNRYKLTVKKSGDAYAWALSGQPGSNDAAAFVDLITGTANPVDKDHGSGRFTVNFDAQTQLDHGTLWQQEDFGQLVVDYDNRTAAHVAATFVGAHNKDPANPFVMNAAYDFVAAVSGGQLQVAFENLTTTGIMSLRTRWSADGSGRADAHYVGPNDQGVQVDYLASECWAGRAADFAMTYDTQSLDPALLVENACQPFVPADPADILLP